MRAETIQRISGVVFAAVGLMHLLRVWLRLPVVVGATDVPQWVSVAAVIVAGSLAALNFTAGRAARSR